jgi:FSR family fosmidomycin resistance protein-like MFS transporter
MADSTDRKPQDFDEGRTPDDHQPEGSPPSASTAGALQTGFVLTFSFAHAVHDAYSAFVAPLLPELIGKLSLSMTQAGVLDFSRTIPSILQPFIGHIGDRVNLRYLIILAPAIAGTLMSLLGVARNYGLLLLLALGAGLGSAGLHAVAPPVAGRHSGANLGWGMGIWMVGGSVGFAVGPVIVVAVLNRFGLGGTPWLMIGGWIASAVLFVRLKGVSTLSPATQHRGSLREGLEALRPLMFPLVAITATWGLLASARMTFLPTFLTQQGESLWFAGISLTVQTGVGWMGALAGGAISDRIGRRMIVFSAMLSAGALMLVFLVTTGWTRLIILMLMGLTAPATRTVLMALVQENCPNNRAMANGTYLAISFILESGSSVIMGAMGDLFGLSTAFLISALILLLGSPLVRLLPVTGQARPG